MKDFFNLLFGSGAKPVRRDVKLRIKYNAQGQPEVEPVAGESFTLSAEGSIDRVTLEPDRFYHCGCSAQKPLGGRCKEEGCANVSCVDCFKRCQHCLKPLCLEHQTSGSPMGLCVRCAALLRRQERLQAVTGFLLHPFSSNPKKPSP